MGVSVIVGMIDFNKKAVVQFDETYILVHILIVYLDGNIGVGMILEMIVAGEHFAIQIHELDHSLLSIGLEMGLHVNNNLRRNFVQRFFTTIFGR